jgi:hypothetical protein
MDDFAQAYQDLALAEDILNKTGDTYGLAARLVYLGMVEESGGEIPQAKNHFTQALGDFLQMGMHGPTVDARAGLARTALIEGDLDTACQQAVEIENTLHESGPLGMEFPMRAYLTCARVWQAINENDRVVRIVDEGYTELAARAEKINPPEWRQSFMEKIPEHIELVALWKEYQL